MDAVTPRFLFTVVCDDVRQEVGNKISIIGVYESAIILERFPAVIPKLCFVMKAQTPADKPFERLKFIVRRDDEIMVEADVTEEQLAAMAAKQFPLVAERTFGLEPANRVVIVSAVMVVSPFSVGKPCRLQCRALTETEELRGGTFLVTHASELGAHGATAESSIR